MQHVVGHHVAGAADTMAQKTAHLAGKAVRKTGKLTGVVKNAELTPEQIDKEAAEVGKYLIEQLKGLLSEHGLTENIWTDAAREASVAARKASLAATGASFKKADYDPKSLRPKVFNACC